MSGPEHPGPEHGSGPTGPQPTGPQPVAGEVAIPATRRGPDLLTLVAGVGALAVAANALLGSVAWLPGLDARWVLAILAMLIGVVLVIGSVLPRHS